ncbi:hypothetical protein GCM10011400_30740 [Paraburkholderia caffeinilytica]|uniref:Uncharacterized protein n=1 Tax=Paraburkholderia caffeinilytica TaxID=1761016 RepID=A0ABQ1MJF6_9BURK|nr:hypothetical protein GCM10011400_30740 [Paraburkholderia caffeinilytica]
MTACRRSGAIGAIEAIEATEATEAIEAIEATEAPVTAAPSPFVIAADVSALAFSDRE